MTLVAPRSRNDPCPCGSGLRYKQCHGAPATVRPAAGLELARARAALAAGEATAAADLCRAVLAGAPDDAAALNLLGEALRERAPADALAAWQRVLEIDPANAEAHFHLGNLLRERGDAAAAIDHYRQALRAAPGHPGILNNLGLALAAVGDHAGAERCYRDVLAGDPQQADALGNLASALFEREAFGEAVAAYDRLFAVRQDVPAAVWVRRAIAQQERGALAAAEESLREAARRAPDDPRIQVNLGTLLIQQNRYADAEPALQRTLELRPDDAYALSMLAHSWQRRCAWQGLDELFARVRQAVDDDRPGQAAANPFTTLSMPLPPATLLRAARRWAAGFAPSVPPPRPVLRRNPGDRLRVGFVSSDFREHPVARLTVDMFESLDRGRLETFGYGLLPRDDGPFGRRIEGALEHFADVSATPTGAMAQRIRDDGIAILFDLNGYTTHDRSRLFALRPAPILVNWLGYAGTLGADWFDCMLTDRFSTPPSAQPFFSERFLHLPRCSMPAGPQPEAAAVAPSREDCGLPPGAFVFCCFNNQYKILPAIFDVWMRLLAQVPGSVAWLWPSNAEITANLRREAAARGVDPDRIVFAARTASIPDHLARHCHADVLLDTAPYNAATTCSDALWMGVPVITCAGETMASRMAGSRLHSLGLPELVTSSLAEYEALALRLARRPDELRALRARITANRSTHALFDMAGFARDLEDCLLGAWRDHAGAATSA